MLGIAPRFTKQKLEVAGKCLVRLSEGLVRLSERVTVSKFLFAWSSLLVRSSELA